MTTTMTFPTRTPSTGRARARRLASRLAILVLFFAIGTYTVGQVVAFDPVESAINGRIWCPGDDASMKTNGRSSGKEFRSNGDSLVCRRGGVVVREVSIPRVMLVDLAVSGGVTLTVMVVGLGSLVAVGKVRRRRR